MPNLEGATEDARHASQKETFEKFHLAGIGRSRKISDSLLAKKCSEREFNNQMFAWKTLNGEKVRVARPLQYFKNPTEEGSGLMVMEFLNGESWDVNFDPSINTKVHEAVRHMHSATPWTTEQQVYPGPLDRGRAESFPWGRGQKEAENTFRNIQDVLACADKRLVAYAKRGRNKKRTLDLEDQKLAICHGDLNPRNILILTDGQVALLDWEWMCMYPVVFDLACLSMLQLEDPHEKQAWLIEVLTSDVCLELEKTREEVEDVLLSLRIVDRASLRWCF